MQKEPHAKPTIKDVARQAGVGVATVSRVLNRSGYFDAETETRVRRAVADLGYRKNIHWTRLKRNSSQTVCFLLGNRAALNSTQMRLLVASQAVFHEHSYDLVFTAFHYSEQTRSAQLALPRVLAEEGIVDGVMLAGQHYGNLLEAFERIGLPYVFMGNNFIGKPKQLASNAIRFDDAAACYEAAGYLARLGHRRIAFVGNGSLHWMRRRQEGYERGMHANHLTPISVDDDWQVTGVEYGRLAAAALLRSERVPTAILAANDELAAGIWKELVQRGIRIPQQVSLVGFGDREEFQILEPSLTTISIFPDKLGAELARMLMQRMADPVARVESRVFPCRLMERSSCAPPSSLRIAMR